MAMLNRIAEILQVEGDLDTVEVRRSRALGILAQPARALELLCRHRHDDACRARSATGPLSPGSATYGSTCPNSLARVAARDLLPPATLHLHLSGEAVQRR